MNYGVPEIPKHRNPIYGDPVFKLIHRLFGTSPEERQRRKFANDWDYYLSTARTPSERAEIDAIFRRASV
jgi:hypothetical protein